jgi:hypothetical protein
VNPTVHFLILPHVDLHGVVIKHRDNSTLTAPILTYPPKHAFIFQVVLYLHVSRKAVQLKVKFTLEQATKAHRGNRCIPRRGGGRSTPRPDRFTRGEHPVPTVQKAGWAPGPVWAGGENLSPPIFDPRTVQPVASRYTY